MLPQQDDPEAKEPSPQPPRDSRALTQHPEGAIPISDGLGNELTDEEIHGHALASWGHKAELWKLVEELQELQNAAVTLLLAAEREDSAVDEFCLCEFREEVADVDVMLDQVRLWLNDEDELDAIKTYKLARTAYQLGLIPWRRVEDHLRTEGSE